MLLYEMGMKVIGSDVGLSLAVATCFVSELCRTSSPLLAIFGVGVSAWGEHG